jgi:hypothetical protein
VAVVTQRYTHRFRERLLHVEGTHGAAPERLAAQAAACLCALEGAMRVGRGAPASPGPAAVGAVLVSSMRS